MEEPDIVERTGLVAAVEQAGDGIVITDLFGTIKYVNPAFCAMTGYGRDEAVGQHTRMLKSGRQPVEFYQELWRTISSGNEWHGDVVNRRKDGTLYDEEMRISPVRGADGKITSYIAIKRDVTEKRAAQETEKLLSAIMKSSDDAIVGYDPAGIILTWNGSAESILGYSAKEMIGQPMSMLALPERRQNIEHFTANILHGNSVFHQDGICVHKDGREIHVSITGCPIKGRTGDVESITVSLRDVTDRREADQTRSLLASIVESSEDAIVGTRLDGTIVSWNRGAEALFGYTCEEAIGKSAQMIPSPEFPNEVRDTLGTIAQGISVSPFDTVGCHKDGTRIDISISVSPTRNAAGEISGAAAIIRDISQRLRDERRVRETEERFRIMADGCPSLMWVTNARGEVEFINRAYEEFCGKTYQQVEGNQWHLLIHPDTAGTYVDAFQRAVREHAPFMGETRVRRADGEWRWIASSAEPRFSQGGEFLGHVGLSPDITERKLVEQALRNSEEKFRQLTENIREVFWMMSPVTKEMLYISPAYEQVWGRTCQSLYANPSSWVEAIHPDDVEEAQKRFIRQTKGEFIKSEYRILCPDGQEKWICDRAFPIRDEAGKVIRVVGIAEEITEQKRYEAELILAREGADVANETKSRFLANMSHEIRTPMNGVIGMLQLLMETELTVEQRRYVTVANGSGRTLLALIDDILDLSKIEARKITLENVSFDVRAAMEEMVDLLRVQANEKGLLLRARVSPAIPTYLRGDEHRLRQILTNLCANAIKFTECGEVRIDAGLLSTSDGKATVQFTVSDTGIGIAEGSAAQIFSPFVQADISTTRKYGGTGLGLAISKQLVTMMGGSIHVESREGQGSNFIFTAVFEKAEAGQTPHSASPGRVARRRDDSQGSKRRILVAEDNVVNREVALSLLRKLGYEASAVKNGRDAVTEVERGSYDLVLMDCEMPVMDGFEATQRIRESLSQDIPIIALTANAMTADRERCLRVGMNDYLAKPVDLGHLEDVLDTWLGSPREADAGMKELDLVR